jgi:hypothetical protein
MSIAPSVSAAVTKCCAAPGRFAPSRALHSVLSDFLHAVDIAWESSGRFVKRCAPMAPSTTGTHGFPRSRKKFHRTPLAKTCSHIGVSALFHEFTALITTTKANFVFKNSSCCDWLLLENSPYCSYYRN